MNIGIIDSGIIKEYINDNVEVIENMDFYDKGKVKPSLQKENLHGTLVLNTIEKYSGRENKYYICNITGKIQEGSYKAVLRSLQYLSSKKELHAIIMSFCIKCKSREIQNILHKLKKQGVILFASQENLGIGGFPATDYSVIGVGREKYAFDSSYTFCKKAPIQIGANANPEFIRLGKHRFELFMGTSKAVPLFAATIMNYVNEYQWNSHEIFKFIKNNRRTHAQLRKQFYIEERKRRKREEKYQWIWKDINLYRKSTKRLEVSLEQQRSDLPILSIVSQLSDVWEMVEYVAKRAEVVVDYEQILFKDFCTVGALAEYIEKQQI